MYKIVLLRHGESVWNKKGLFTGWVDVGLTKKGEAEAKKAGQELKKHGFKFDLAYTSFLRRAAKTLKLALKEMKTKKTLIKADWRLNERHYGNLQGLSKEEMVKKFGAKKVLTWRRSYDIRPPKITAKNPYQQTGDLRYQGIKVPSTESLKDVVTRVTPFWQKEIIPQLKDNKKIIIVGSGNSLRAIVKYLDKISPSKIVNLNIPTGIPLVYELDEKLKPRKHYYLASLKKLALALEKAAHPGPTSRPGSTIKIKK